MDDRQFNRFIMYSIIVVIGYHILGFFIQYLTYGVIGLIIYRIVYQYQKRR